MPLTYTTIRKLGKGLSKRRMKTLSSHAWVTQTHAVPFLEKKDNLFFRNTIEIRVTVRDLKLLFVRWIPSCLTGHLQLYTLTDMMLIK